MQIILNGKPETLETPMQVDQLLVHLGLDARKVAVERNLAIVPRSAHMSTLLCEGDAIEIVTFMGGG